MNLRKEVITSFHLVLLGRELAADYFLSYFEIAPKNRQGNKNAKEREAFRRKSKSAFSD